MGRSVNYASNAHVVLYLYPEFDEDDYDFQWDFFMDDITQQLCEIAPSLDTCEVWENRETRSFLHNYLCRIAISEYCGLVSLSFIPETGYYYGISHHWIDQIMPKVKDRFKEMMLIKVGTLSNGEAVFRKAEVEE